MMGWRRLVFPGALLWMVAVVQAGSFRDPAPPTLLPVEESRSPGSHTNSGVHYIRSPKPLSEGAVTQDWPSFLGPTHNAVSAERPLLVDWGEAGPPLVWEMPKGMGYSSPAISGKYLVFFHRLGDNDTVECLHPETGERYWKFEYPTRFRDRYGYNNGPRSSPVISGDRVYTYGADGTLHCLHLPSGQVYWKRNLSEEFEAPQDFFGVGTTPLVEGDLLILNIGAPSGPCVAAFDKNTGVLVWGAGTEWGASYASPVPVTLHGKRRVLVFAGGESDPPTGGLLCIDPDNGAIDFRFPWRSKTFESVNASCPTVLEDKVFVSASYDTGGAMLQVMPDFKPQLLWESPSFGTHMATSVAKEGFLFGIDGRHSNTSSLVCFDALSGKEIWRETPAWETTLQSRGREAKIRGGVFRGTLLLTGEGKFLCLGEAGDLLWLELSHQGYRELARVSLFEAPETWALPVLSHGLLYVMQNYQSTHDKNQKPRLLCYDLRG